MRSADFQPRLAACALALAAATLLWAAPPAEAGEQLHILQPGYPGGTEEARGFLSDLSAALRAAGAPATLAPGEYHNDEEQGLKAIRRDQPRLGILSLGMYLKHRQELKLTAIAWSRPEAPFRVVVRKGAFKALGELKGKRLGGTPFLDRAFVERVVLTAEAPGVAPAAFDQWTLVPLKSFSRTLRDLRTGKLDAALLSEHEYQACQRQADKTELVALHTTAAQPTAIVCVLGDSPSTEEAARWEMAFSALQASKAGQALLKEMGIERFAAVERLRLQSLERRYDAPAQAESKR